MVIAPPFTLSQSVYVSRDSKNLRGAEVMATIGGGFSLSLIAAHSSLCCSAAWVLVSHTKVPPNFTPTLMCAARHSRAQNSFCHAGAALLLGGCAICFRKDPMSNLWFGGLTLILNAPVFFLLPILPAYKLCVKFLSWFCAETKGGHVSNPTLRQGTALV